MRAQYDPWGRSSRAASRQRTVPLDTALALRDQAEQAMDELERCKQELGAAEAEARRLRDALATSRAALKDEHQARTELQGALATAEARLAAAERRAKDAENRAQAAQERTAGPEEVDGQGSSELDPSMEAAVASLRADLANIRRHQREAELRARRSGRAELLLPMLDTLDDLDRAMSAVDAATAEGLRSVERRLVQRLEATGARLVPIDGGFDPGLHEAVGTAAGPRDRVVQVVGRGLLDDAGEVLRPARVLIGDGSIPNPQPSGGAA